MFVSMVNMHAGVLSMPDSLQKANQQAASWSGVSLKTNLLWWGAAEPNIGLEFPVGKHVSLEVDGGLKTWPRWLPWDTDNVDNTHHWRNFAVVPEARYYFDQVYDGFFIGADALYTHFNVGNVKFPFGLYPETQDHRVQGSFWAGGLLAGYSLWWGRHLRIEAQAGVAAGLAAYDRFDCDHCGTKTDEIRKPAVVPKLALSMAWNPVVRDKRPQYGTVTQLLSGRDTLTVLTPPVAFVVHLSGVKAPETTGDRLAGKNNWVIPIEKYRPLDYLTRPGRDSILYVQFPVSSGVLDRDYAHNNPTLNVLTDAITAICADERTEEILISVVGLASIEGPAELNDTLSVRRARAVADELNAQTGVSRRLFEVIGKGEAWDWFREQVSARPEGFSAEEIAELEKVLTFPDPDLREKLLKTNQPLYNKVAQQLLADQRNAGYIRVYYGNAPDPATEKFNGEVMDLIKAKRYAEAVRMVEADPTLLACSLADPEAMNALGVARYFTALDEADVPAEQKALELLRRAAELGSDAASQNLEGAKVYGPARKEYEAWQAIMKEE